MHAHLELPASYEVSVRSLAGLGVSMAEGEWSMAAKGLLIAGGCYLARTYLSKLEPVLLIFASGVLGAFIF